MFHYQIITSDCKTSPTCNPKHTTLQVTRPFITLANPFCQLSLVPWPEPNLEILWLQRQACLDRITLHCIQNGSVVDVLCWKNLVGTDQAEENGIKFAVGELLADTHATTSTIAIVEGSGPFGLVEEAFREEQRRILVLAVVVVGSPSILELH